jgi:putative membrane protein
MKKKHFKGYIEGVKYLRKLPTKYWWYILFSKPDLYLYSLIRNTILTGIITTLIFLVFQKYGAHEQTIPSAFHALLAFVIGLVLVFRTNTAYDRWWKAREIFSKVETQYIYFVSILKISPITAEIRKEYIDSLNTTLDCVYLFLVEDSSDSFSDSSKRTFFDKIYALQKQNKENNLIELDLTVKEILDCFTSLERIHDTPIPTSYSLHIKVSIFAYLLTLPFGTFYGLGYWSIVLVMILYYIIAGVEIISNEIENPFRGDPNDLPVLKYITKLKEEISEELKD